MNNATLSNTLSRGIDGFANGTEEFAESLLSNILAQVDFSAPSTDITDPDFELELTDDELEMLAAAGTIEEMMGKLDYDLTTVADPEEERHDVGEESQSAEKLLGVLRDDERELVFLKYYKELSNKEIAAQLGMNASTVSTKLSRAVAKMRKVSDRM